MSSAAFSACQGTTVDINAVIRTAGGGAFDITAHNIVWVLSATQGSVPLITKSTAAGTLTITSGPLGAISFQLTAVETNGLPAGHYHHECRCKSPAPNSKTYCAWHDIAIIEESSIGVI